jgi:hypothetical protein
MWHLRKEADGYAEFVHLRTGEVVYVTLNNPTTPIRASKCTSRPGCPCEFCIQTRAELSEGGSERDTQDQSAREFIDAYLRESIHLPALR